MSNANLTASQSTYTFLSRGLGKSMHSRCVHGGAVMSRMGVRKKRLAYSTLSQRPLIHVFDDHGIDRTPKSMYDSEYPVIDDWQPTVLDFVDEDLTSGQHVGSVSENLQTNSFTPLSGSQQLSLFNFAQIYPYKSYSTPQEDSGSSAYSIELRKDDFKFTFQASHDSESSTRVALIIKETKSIPLLSVTSTVEDTRSPSAEQVLQDNKAYLYLKTGDERFFRNTTETEQQTSISCRTFAANPIPLSPLRHIGCWVTSWQLYDDENGVSDGKRDLKKIHVDKQWKDLSRNSRFMNALMLMERILGQPTWECTQLLYKQNFKQDPLDVNAQFLYELEPLWTYKSSFVNGRAVSCVAINPLNTDIVAVGYGKYLHTDTDQGCVAIWSVKNLQHPENIYRFTSSVTCVDFAKNKPNLLAVSCLDSSVVVLDVASFPMKVVYRKQSSLEDYQAASFITWWTLKFGGDEVLIAASADGRVFQLKIKDEEILDQHVMIHINRLERKVYGVELAEHRGECVRQQLPVSRPSATQVARYPRDSKLYLVAADDGTVHKCSVNFCADHLDVFMAHHGYVSTLKFSPFCSQIFLTSGADGTVRVWAWDVSEPLLTLRTGAAVQDVAWSPCNATILASISGPCLAVWDLRRKTHCPTSVTYHHSNTCYSCLKFTVDGSNIILGDVLGNVLVVALKGMPFDQVFKDRALAAAIEKELIVKPHLLDLVRKLGPPFSPVGM